MRVLQADDQETLFITHIEGTDLEAARSVHVTSAQGGVDDQDESEGEPERPAMEAAPSGEAEPVAQRADAAIDEDGRRPTARGPPSATTTTTATKQRSAKQRLKTRRPRPTRRSSSPPPQGCRTTRPIRTRPSWQSEEES